MGNFAKIDHRRARERLPKMTYFTRKVKTVKILGADTIT